MKKILNLVSLRKKLRSIILLWLHFESSESDNCKHFLVRTKTLGFLGEKYEVSMHPLLWGKHGGGGSSIVKVPGDVPPARVYFFGLLV